MPRDRRAGPGVPWLRKPGRGRAAGTALRDMRGTPPRTRRPRPWLSDDPGQPGCRAGATRDGGQAGRQPGPPACAETCSRACCAEYPREESPVPRPVTDVLGPLPVTLAAVVEPRAVPGTLAASPAPTAARARSRASDVPGWRATPTAQARRRVKSLGVVSGVKGSAMGPPQAVPVLERVQAPPPLGRGAVRAVPPVRERLRERCEAGTARRGRPTGRRWRSGGPSMRRACCGSWSPSSPRPSRDRRRAARETRHTCRCLEQQRGPTS